MNELHKKQRIRSPSYPGIDLQEAIQLADRFKSFGGRHLVTVKFVLDHWGYKSTSSNGMKAIAALSSFGLIESIGSGDDRKVKLSERALRILVDHDGSPERKKAIEDAALSPKIYSELWGKWGGDLPPEPEIRSYLILDRNFNETAVGGFLKDYRKTITFAELETSAKIIESPSEKLIADDDNILSEIDMETLHAEDQKDLPKRAAVTPLTERITGPDGAIVLQFSATPSYEQYKFLEAYIRLRMTVLTPAREV
jgi:hypothetical protein